MPERYVLPETYQRVAEVIGWDAAIAFGLAVWQEKRPPSQSKIFGRGSIYIPRALDGRCGKDLVRLAGPENAALLVKEFHGMQLSFSNMVAASISRRNRAIADQVQQGIIDPARLYLNFLVLRLSDLEWTEKTQGISRWIGCTSDVSR